MKGERITGNIKNVKNTNIFFKDLYTTNMNLTIGLVLIYVIGYKQNCRDYLKIIVLNHYAKSHIQEPITGTKIKKLWFTLFDLSI